MVGIVGQIDLGAMVYSAFQFRFLFVAQTLKQWRNALFAFARQNSIGGNVPGFTRQKRTVDYPCGAIMTGGPLADTVFFGKLGD